jgi:hypothetical protein
MCKITLKRAIPIYERGKNEGDILFLWAGGEKLIANPPAPVNFALK